MLTLRSIGFVLSVLLIPIASVPDRPRLSSLIAVTIFLVWQALLFRPRIVIDEQVVHVHRLFSVVRRPVSAIESVSLIESSVLWYPTKELCLVIDGRLLIFSWVAWNANTEAMFGWSTEKSQQRMLDKLRPRNASV